MPLSRLALLGSALALTLPMALHAEPAGPATALPMAQLRSTMQFTLHSAINGADYQIQIFTPRRPPPPGGYPVLYLLDGNALFGGYAQAMGNRSNAHEIAAAVIVGISGTPGEQGGDRTRDFSFSDLTPHEKAISKDLGTAPPFGGADRFYDVITREIRPRVASLAPVDPARGALMGWSLGGHFVMHVLFEHPEAFQTFIALSPALWRSERILFRNLPTFPATLDRSGARPRLFIGVGSLEEEALPGLLEGQMSHEDLAAELRYGRMVGNMRDMAARLKPVFADHGMPLKDKVFDGDTHNSVPWSAINPILDFAFPLQRPDITSP